MYVYYMCIRVCVSFSRTLSRTQNLSRTVSCKHQTPWMPPAFGFSIPRYADPRERSYVGMQVCVHVYTYLMYIRAHKYVHILLYMCVYIYTHNLLHVYVYMHIRIYTFTNISIYTYSYIHVYARIYDIQRYVYIRIHI